MKARKMLFVSPLCAIFLVCSVSGGELTDVIQKCRLTGGVILLVNADTAVYDEAAVTGCTVLGLETDEAVVQSLRKRFLARRIYGKLSVTGFDGKTLPCIDQLVNVVVVEGVQAGLPAVRAIVEADPTCVTRDMVVKVCRERLSSHKVPGVVEIRERLERDAGGNALRVSLDA